MSEIKSLQELDVTGSKDTNAESKADSRARMQKAVAADLEVDLIACFLADYSTSLSETRTPLTPSNQSRFVTLTGIEEQKRFIQDQFSRILADLKSLSRPAGSLLEGFVVKAVKISGDRSATVPTHNPFWPPKGFKKFQLPSLSLCTTSYMLDETCTVRPARVHSSLKFPARYHSHHHARLVTDLVEAVMRFLKILEESLSSTIAPTTTTRCPSPLQKTLNSQLILGFIEAVPILRLGYDDAYYRPEPVSSTTYTISIITNSAYNGLTPEKRSGWALASRHNQALKSLNLPIDEPITLQTDSVNGMNAVTSCSYRKPTRWLDNRYFAVQQYREEGLMELKYVDTDNTSWPSSAITFTERTTMRAVTPIYLSQCSARLRNIRLLLRCVSLRLRLRDVPSVGDFT
ncbi:hypothetical protein TEQG_04994 [Trichophyton equinum CBS 127.97]|uniref:Uncharacterized protein n=1 Tax=Trichophyton equinum (strain ATCC MYA-4606 / CBS 127.97) TaxID=559882 RepID=F2PVR9_TRIEC|nr:hypothetical protein TEQG_04994 [Trichophyton equinum CBS 127.97]